MAEWMKQLRADELSAPTFALPKEDLFAPIAKEVSTFARHLSAAKAAAGEEARLRQSAESLWTPERLKEHVKAKLHGRPLFVVSNREPYMHMHKGRKVECIVPAGGLVTASAGGVESTTGGMVVSWGIDGSLGAASGKGSLGASAAGLGASEHPTISSRRTGSGNQPSLGAYMRPS